MIFFPRRKKEKNRDQISSSFRCLNSLCNIIIRHDTQMKCLQFKGEKLSSEIVIVTVIIIANLIYLFFCIKTKILLTRMASEKEALTYS